MEVCPKCYQNGLYVRSVEYDRDKEIQTCRYCGYQYSANGYWNKFINPTQDLPPLQVPQKGDTVILPNGHYAAVQGWAIEQSIKDFPKRKPYKRVSRKQALTSGAPMLEVWVLVKNSWEPTEFWPLDSVRIWQGQK